MTVNSAQLREALHLLSEMLHEAINDWKTKHFTTWRSV